jgi:hypothetical protein
MVCPKCKSDYRQGFTRCVDCDVDLVSENSPDALASRREPTPGDPSEDPFCSFWKGEDPRVHADLCSVLDEAGIPHNTVCRRDHLFNLSNFSSFEVGVPFSLFQKAELAIQNAFGTEDEEDRETLNVPRLIPSESPTSIQKLLAQITPSEEESSPGPPTSGEESEWFPEEATVRVWNAAAGEPGDFLVAALHENGIRCRLETASRSSLYVLPEDEPRALEIVREVVEGRPPE